MAASGRRVTVTTSPTRLDTADKSQDHQSGDTIVLRNTDASASVDIGGASVASGSGFELVAGAGLSYDLAGSDGLYAIAASGTVRVDVLETGV